MSQSKVWKWVTGALELVLAIPLIGGTIVMGFYYVPLVVMLALHIVTLVVSSKENTSKAASILGVITSCVAWIPIVGWVMHLITAILLMVAAAKKEVQPPPPPYFGQPPQQF